MEANASHGAVRGRGDVAVQYASDATRVGTDLCCCGGCCITIFRVTEDSCRVAISGHAWPGRRTSNNANVTMCVDGQTPATSQ